MVLSAVDEPALIVPDAATWAIWGVDVRALGLAPSASPSRASVLALPQRVPRGLAEAVQAAWSEMPPPRRLFELEGPRTGGRGVAELLEQGREMGKAGGGHGSHSAGAAEDQMDMDGGHGGHGGHGDMMEITGEPSRDGLVMESIQFEHGPLAPGLPGGLALDVDLDGDVVSSCRVRATLSVRRGAPDPLSPAAWSATRPRRGGSFAAVAEMERERALSHLGWLSSFGSILGWQQLAAEAWRAASPLIGAELEAVAAEEAWRRAVRILSRLEGSRRLSDRTRGRGVVSAAMAKRLRLAGPNARASGIVTDARSRDPRYRELGFAVRTQSGGDAEARTMQRAGEAVDALALAGSALRRSEDATGRASAEVEAPRGPLSRGRLERVARRGRTERGLAGDLALGLEWASALTVIASFDLSPWELGS